MGHVSRLQPTLGLGKSALSRRTNLVYRPSSTCSQIAVGKQLVTFPSSHYFSSVAQGIPPCAPLCATLCIQSRHRLYLTRRYEGVRRFPDHKVCKGRPSPLHRRYAVQVAKPPRSRSLLSREPSNYCTNGVNLVALPLLKTRFEDVPAVLPTAAPA